MNFVPFAVGEGLLYEMAAVAGGVDRDVLPSGRNRPLKHRLEGPEVVVVLRE